MAQSVNVNFRIDETLKKNVEDICQRMGMNTAGGCRQIKPR